MGAERRAVAAVTVGKPLATTYRRSRRDPEKASDGKTRVLSCLNEAIDRSGLLRKALARDLGVSEPQFSRLTSGAQAFDLADLALLPRTVRVEFLRRLGALDGLRVHDPDDAELSAELRAALDGLVRAYVAKAR